MDSHLREQVNALHARICGGLADPLRIMILYALHEHPRSVGDLTTYLDVPQPTVSRHLKTLRDCGLVYPERDAQMMIYHLKDDRVIEALDLLLGVLNGQLQDQSALSRFVAD